MEVTLNKGFSNKKKDNNIKIKLTTDPNNTIFTEWTNFKIFGVTRKQSANTTEFIYINQLPIPRVN